MSTKRGYESKKQSKREIPSQKTITVTIMSNSLKKRSTFSLNVMGRNMVRKGRDYRRNEGFLLFLLVRGNA